MISGAASDAPPARRTHAERRRETQERLIRATIESLAEDGWSGTTTRSIAQRAGVSQGAQQHHYPTKRALVEAALSTILDEQSSLAADWEVPEGEPQRIDFLLDRLWEIHCLPVNLAVLELLTVARTDPETADSVGRLQQAAEEAAVAVGHALLPEAAEHEDFAGWVLSCVATMRGIVALAAVEDPTESRLWPQARSVLVRGMPR